MEEAIKIIQDMVDDLQRKCPAQYTIDNEYSAIQDKIETLNEAIHNLKNHLQ